MARIYRDKRCGTLYRGIIRYALKIYSFNLNMQDHGVKVPWYGMSEKEWRNRNSIIEQGFYEDVVNSLNNAEIPEEPPEWWEKIEESKELGKDAKCTSVE